MRTLHWTVCLPIWIEKYRKSSLYFSFQLNIQMMIQFIVCHIIFFSQIIISIWFIIIYSINKIKKRSKNYLTKPDTTLSWLDVVKKKQRIWISYKEIYKTFLFKIYLAVFLRLAHVLTTLDTSKCYHAKPNNLNEFFLATKPYANKLNLIRASIDHIVCCFENSCFFLEKERVSNAFFHIFKNFSGPDPTTKLTRVIFVKSKMGKLSVKALIDSLAPYGKSEIISQSSYSAYVAVDSFNR